MIRKIARFLKALVWHIFTGFKEVTPEERRSRYRTCVRCEFFDKDNRKCDSCGCYLPLKTKWKDQSCPEDKW